VVSTALINSSYVNLPNGQGSLLKVQRNGINLQLNWGDASLNSFIVPGGANIRCIDGYIHTIDRALDIPRDMMVQLTSHGLSDFVSLIGFGGGSMLDMISTPGVTVLVPDNQAFASTIPNWRPPNVPIPSLQQLTRFHVVNGLVFFQNMTSNCYQTMLSTSAPGRICTSQIGSGVIQLNDYMTRVLATITSSPTLEDDADIVAKNGIIHILDKVMIPNLSFYKEAKLA